MTKPLLLLNEWVQILTQCGVKAEHVYRWAPVFYETVKTDSFSKGADELGDFLGQVLHESGFLTRISENLNYTAERLVQVWPSRFPTVNDARPYAHNSEALANKVYGGRMGNIKPDDGWRYRGRGPIQITGRENYSAVGHLMKQDLIGLPELLEQPRFALEATIHWWEDRIPDSMLGDVEKVTRRVNGGIHGLAERQHVSIAASRALA